MKKRSVSKKLLMAFAGTLFLGNVDATNIPTTQNNADEVTATTSTNSNNQIEISSLESNIPWIDSSNINTKNRSGDTALTTLARKKRVNYLVNIVKKFGNNIKIQNHIVEEYQGNNILMWAIKHRKDELAKELIKIASRDDINAKNKDRWTALHLASRYGASTELVELLLAKADNSDINAGSYFSNILSRGINWIPGFILKPFIKQNDRIINARTENGNTALHLASRNGAPFEVINVLIKNGANINAKNKGERTHLTLLAKQDKIDDLVKIVKEFGDKIKIQNHIVGKSRGNNILMWAIRHNKDELAKELIRISSKDDINAKNNSDRTTLDIAKSSGAPDDIISLLESRLNEMNSQ